jgi:pimeloyl-ACP methyl ester carboxylesterase
MLRESARRQFLVLHRLFLARMIDLEILSARGDVRDLIVRFVSILAAFSFVLTYLICGRYFSTTLPRAQLLYSILNDEEFLISATVAVAGLFAVLAWNAVFPDRRDCLVLGPLPISTPTIILAKLSAMAAALGVSLVAINIFTGLVFPLATADKSPLHSLAAWWITIVAAGVFIFSSMLALQGLAAQLMSWGLFMRVSGILQMLALFAVIGLFFVTPPFAATILHPRPVVNILPSFWFTGLLQVLNGDPNPIFKPLATIALRNLAVAITIAALTWALSYYRNIRRIVQAPDIAPSAHGRMIARIVRWAAFRFLSKPLDRAILMFTSRTIARSRQHRLLLAACGGIGFATALAFSRLFLDTGTRERWDEPNVPFLIAGLLLLFCAIAGTRAAFAIPLALPANWAFRITAVQSPAAYFAAVRKSLVVLAALPVWIAATVAYFMIWPGRPALAHMLVLLLFGLWLVDRWLYQFRKIPFACSWLPAGVQRKMRTSIYVLLFLITAGLATEIELWTMEKFARFAVLLSILAGMAVWARRRSTTFANAAGNRLQFEDLPPAEVFALDLRPDAEWSGDEAYVDDGIVKPKLAKRLRPFAVAVLIALLAGLSYERIGEWQDHRRYPRVGHPVNIGGRTLNIFCSGEGSPAVVFDAGGNQPGYSWVLVQPEVAKSTRACWYDRAGYGWSDSAPHPRSSADIADDLHKLLRAAGVPPPWVLVGHSFGGFNVRVFAAQNPGEVAGMVLVDSADEFPYEGPMPDSLRGPGTYIPKSLWGAGTVVLDFLVQAGVARLIDNGVPSFRGHLTERDAGVIHSLQLEPKAFDAQSREGIDRDRTLAQVQAVHSLGNMPLVVLTAAGGIPHSDDEVSQAVAAFMHDRIYTKQARLATLSTRGRQIIVERSGHDIPSDAPEAVVEAVRLITVTRSSTLPGSTGTSSNPKSR